MFHKCWAIAQHFRSKYSHRQFIKVGESFETSKVIGEGAVVGKSPVSGLAPHWIEGWLLPGLILSLKKKKNLPLKDVSFQRDDNCQQNKNNSAKNCPILLLGYNCNCKKINHSSH